MIRVPEDVGGDDQEDEWIDGILHTSRLRRNLTTGLLLVAPISVLMGMWMGGWL